MSVYHFFMAGKHLSLLVHFIWSTAGREPWIGSDWEDDLYGIVGGVMKKKNAKLICAGGMFDHIYLYASLPSTISIADFVNAVKSNSSRWVHESFATRKGLPGSQVTAHSVSVSQKSRKSLDTFGTNIAITPSEVLRMSSLSSLCEMKLSTTKNIYGVDRDTMPATHEARSAEVK